MLFLVFEQVGVFRSALAMHKIGLACCVGFSKKFHFKLQKVTSEASKALRLGQNVHDFQWSKQKLMDWSLSFWGCNPFDVNLKTDVKFSTGCCDLSWNWQARWDVLARWWAAQRRTDPDFSMLEIPRNCRLQCSMGWITDASTQYGWWWSL